MTVKTRRLNGKNHQDRGLKRIKQIKEKIREEFAKKMEISTWGLHNHLIEHRLKIRMTEELVDCASRLLVEPDERTERELKIL